MLSTRAIAPTERFDPDADVGQLQHGHHPDPSAGGVGDDHFERIGAGCGGRQTGRCLPVQRQGDAAERGLDVGRVGHVLGDLVAVAERGELAAGTVDDGGVAGQLLAAR